MLTRRAARFRDAVRGFATRCAVSRRGARFRDVVRGFATWCARFHGHARCASGARARPPFRTLTSVIPHGSGCDVRLGPSCSDGSAQSHPAHSHRIRRSQIQRSHSHIPARRAHPGTAARAGARAHPGTTARAGAGASRDAARVHPGTGRARVHPGTGRARVGRVGRGDGSGAGGSGGRAGESAALQPPRPRRRLRFSTQFRARARRDGQQPRFEVDLVSRH